MKQLEIPFLNYLDERSAIEMVSLTMDSLEKHSIDQQPWKEYPYKPKVYFSIGHSGNCLFLKYYVSESTVRASYTRPNDPVFKDSCVEFFIALDSESEYYNFEFNAIGTCKLNFGTNRKNRKLVSEEAISDIRFVTNIKNNSEDGNISWQIMIVIPVSTFTEHNMTSFHEYKGRANFYKCGDELPVPHFLSWNNVIAHSPDFHVPESFGEIYFQ